LANVRHQPPRRYWEPGGSEERKYKIAIVTATPTPTAKTCPDSNANADMGHRCADNCTQ